MSLASRPQAGLLTTSGECGGVTLKCTFACVRACVGEQACELACVSLHEPVVWPVHLCMCPCAGMRLKRYGGREWGPHMPTLHCKCHWCIFRVCGGGPRSEAKEWRAQDVSQRTVNNARALWRRAVKRNLADLVRPAELHPLPCLQTVHMLCA